MKIVRTEIDLSQGDVQQMMTTPQGMNALMILGGQAGAPPLLLPQEVPQHIPDPFPGFPPVGTEFNPRPMPRVRQWNFSRLMGMGFAALGVGTFALVTSWIITAIPPEIAEEATPIQPSIPQAIPDLPIGESTEIAPVVVPEVIEEAPLSTPQDTPEEPPSNAGNPPPIQPTTIPCSSAFCN